MSLDVYLTIPGKRDKGSGIFVREDGAMKEITRDEWDKVCPGREPIIAIVEPDDGNDDEDESGNQVYWANITHNLNSMAEAAGIYKYLWRPDEIEITRAAQLIDPLRAGLTNLESDRARFEQYNPENGWGNYDGLVRFVRNYLAACEQYPTATVTVSR